MHSDSIRAIEANIREAKKIVEEGEALERLRSNQDFRKVVMDGYFKNEAIRLVHLKSDPGMQSAESQKSILMQMDAIGSLDQYFRTVFHKASIAQKAIASDGETLEELLAEDVNHG